MIRLIFQRAKSELTQIFLAQYSFAPKHPQKRQKDQQIFKQFKFAFLSSIRHRNQFLRAPENGAKPFMEPLIDFCFAFAFFCLNILNACLKLEPQILSL